MFVTIVFVTSPTLTVVGAGLGGLTLARVLHRHGVEAVVLDLDPSAGARQQGGMLDIHEETGQRALRAAGLHDAFRALVHPGGEALRVLDRHGVVHREEADDGGGTRPEIERGALRRLLLDSLPAGTVRWGSRLTAATPRDGGGFTLHLADGTTSTTDLLVGADGAWSRVRPLLTDASPAYTGISFVEFDLREADARHPLAAATVGTGMFFALGEDKGLLAHRETDGSLHVYAGVRVPEKWSQLRIDTRAALLQAFEGWDETLLRLVRDADGGFVPRPIHALPTGLRWDRVPGVTLLGDAAHVMSPFAGEGANLALFDGAELARELLGHPGDVEAALAAYEADLFTRSAEKAADAARNLDVIFSPDAPAPLVEVFAGFDAARAGAR